MMEISKVTCIRVGQFKYDTKRPKGKKYTTYKNGLVLSYDKNFPMELKSKPLAIVYFLSVDGKIYKIGQTHGASGIHGCLNFYAKAGMDNPGPNRFAINYLIREKMKKGKKVEVYFKYLDPVKVLVEGLTSSTAENKVVNIDAKVMEEKCLDEYRVVEGRNPEWNFQENGTGIPDKIQQKYAQERIKIQASK